ncbi:protein matrimony [Drosophila nasuta]|uniref:protein matrimony n=1 Tax=Drosophila nasuta TaxID=42062 RepID=UPI00295E729D|nr:protein matrimony [Drosophila nasuta]
MAESCTPKNRPKLCLTQNSLNVNSINVRCFSPIIGDFRSPNLSPITNMRASKSPISPMHFKKPFEKPQQQQQQQPTTHQQQALPPKIKFSVHEKKKKQHKEEENNNNNSLDCFMDDTSNSSIETSLCKETRRRSLQAANHNYVVNHANNVKEVLILVGLEQYLDKFEKSHIDMIDLVSMKRSDLKKIGLRKDKDCDRILDALKEL